MRYIILDLEWNQPVSWQSSTYRRIGDRLIFEMIQIGAVRLSEDGDITDSISIPIAPTHYIRIHPRIRRMTGLGPEELAGAPAFREALEQFVRWCGEDYVLLTWGCDDVSVLQQNIDFFGCGDISLPPLYDIQQLFAEAHELKDRPSLQKAMELVNIEADESMAFHNARNDAWYTALVFRTLPDPAAVLNYARQPKALIHRHHKPEESAGRTGFPSVREALACEAVRKPVCPRCGRNLTLDGEYVPQSPDKYVAIGRCRNHGRLLLRLRFLAEDDGGVSLRQSVSPATQTHVAYVHTKQFQAAQRQEPEDPDEALRRAARSSVPFD